jgi:hypothetical protein
MARDLFSLRDGCRYCHRPAAIDWGHDVRTCTHSICKGLTYREIGSRPSTPADARAATASSRGLLHRLHVPSVRLANPLAVR